MKPPISVIMPCFNHEPFVHDAVSSVLSQTLSDFEIIAIDDCSDDATAERLEEFDDPRLTLIRHEENRGLAKTINEGIRRSHGNYISILNSDHLYHPERLKYCLEMCETHDLYLIGTDVDVVSDDTEEPNTEKTAWLEGHHRVRNEYLASQDLTSTMMEGNLFITTSNLFCRRSLFDAIGPLADHRHVDQHVPEFFLGLFRGFTTKGIGRFERLFDEVWGHAGGSLLAVPRATVGCPKPCDCR